MTSVPIVKDDPQTVDEITIAPNHHGIIVDSRGAERGGLLKAAAGDYDAIGLDRKLTSGLDGLGMRAKGMNTPVLILGALSGVDEWARGLPSLGALRGSALRRYFTIT